ncbi:MAG TPA: nucleolar RNA-binding Nop10p family protein [Candidatus Nanoarchaeia archaeon]|nr:nucleolar RNA-binding Nop10p family protein [Candidatus Nanoarchaeia archaeon]
MKHLLRCVVCKEYTMKEEHCGSKALQLRPPKWSPEDKYAKYRRMVKEGQSESVENNQYD